MDPETAQIVVLTFLGRNWPWCSNFMNMLVSWHAKPCTHLLKGILPTSLLACQILTGINFKFHPIRGKKMTLLHSCPFCKKAVTLWGHELYFQRVYSIDSFDHYINECNLFWYFFSPLAVTFTSFCENPVDSFDLCS